MSDIFVSYSSKDRPWVKTFAEALKQENWSVWWDREIRVGEGFSRTIEQELDSARCVVVIWSHESVASEWVPAEADEGRKRNVLIPVSLEACRPPLVFRGLQTADLSGWDGDRGNEVYQAVVRDIARVMGEKREPAPVQTVGAKPGKRRLAALLLGLGLMIAAGYGGRSFLFPVPAEIVSFEPDRTQVQEGGEVVLSWETRHARTVFLETVGDVPASGQAVVKPAAGAFYRLRVTDSRGREVFKTVKIEVTASRQTATNDSTTVEDARNQLRRQRETAEKLVTDWMAAMLARDVDTLARLADVPFYFDNEILVRAEDVRQRYTSAFAQPRRPEDDGWQISSLKLKTIAEQKAEGYDEKRDRVLRNLQLNDDDYMGIVMMSQPGRASGEGTLLFIRKRGDALKLAGFWN